MTCSNAGWEERFFPIRGDASSDHAPQADAQFALFAEAGFSSREIDLQVAFVVL